MSSAKLNEAKQCYLDCEAKVTEQLGGTKAFKLASEKTHQPAGRLALGGAAFVILAMWCCCRAFLVYTIGLVYPAVCSVRAIESPTTADDKQWLTYWVVFAVLSTVDYFAACVAETVPFYQVLKLSLFLYMMMPQTHGAAYFYDKCIRPCAVKGTSLEGSKITQLANQAKEATQELVDDVKEKAS